VNKASLQELRKLVAEYQDDLHISNDRRSKVWYKKWKNLLQETSMPEDAVLHVWKMIDASHGFKYDHVALSSLQSLALALKDREDGK